MPAFFRLILKDEWCLSYRISKTTVHLGGQGRLSGLCQVQKFANFRDGSRLVDFIGRKPDRKLLFNFHHQIQVAKRIPPRQLPQRRLGGNDVRARVKGSSYDVFDSFNSIGGFSIHIGQLTQT
jgi:hypothetical protein